MKKILLQTVLIFAFAFLFFQTIQAQILFYIVQRLNDFVFVEVGHFAALTSKMLKTPADIRF